MKEHSADRFYSHGKLLITAEYLVLEGAEALAVPTRPGQKMEIRPGREKGLHWKSFDMYGNCWLEVVFDHDLQLVSASMQAQALPLQHLLIEARKLNPDFLSDNQATEVITSLEFPNNWGLGSSSTLVSNIAAWAKVDPFVLQFEVFGGSGYDIACARSDRPLFYQLADGVPRIREVSFDPVFHDQLFFVHLNRKQNSREEINRFRSLGKIKADAIYEITDITLAMISCSSIGGFEVLLDRHEKIISALIGRKTVKELLFSDYDGHIKSLGAWGGDFILCTGGTSAREYFRNKGYDTILSYEEMVLRS